MTDTILYNAGLGAVAASKLQVTPTGGTTGNLGDFINGGTVAQSLPAGSTIGAGSTLTTPVISGIALETSITSAITAGATQTLAGAVALTSKWNVISTVTTLNDAVKLPVAGAANVGQVIWVINNGASAASIFPGESATAIDTHATAAAATLSTLHRAVFLQNTASTWVSSASVSAAS